MKKIFIIFFLITLVGVVFPKTSQASLGCSEYGVMAYEDHTGYCKCMAGYVWGTSFLGKPYCVSGDSKCKEKYGYNARYNSLSDTCECSYGYVFGKDMFGDTQCVDPDDVCKEKLGYNSKYNSISDKCECKSGYELTLKTSGGLTCESCMTKYGYHSSYSYTSKKCECDDDYTLDNDNQCVEKQNNVYFILKEVNSDNKEAIIKSTYDNRYYFITYSSGCYSSSINRYLNKNIVLNLGTDFSLDRWDKIVLQNDNETCDIRSVEKVDSDFTLEMEETPVYYFNTTNLQETNINTVQPKTIDDTIKSVILKESAPASAPKETTKELKCQNGFAVSLDKKYCIKIPENAHVVESKTDVWLCNDGFEERNNACIKKVKNIETAYSVVTTTYDITNSAPINNSTIKNDSLFRNMIKELREIFKKIKFW